MGADMIRLGCFHCETNNLDGAGEIPVGWSNILEFGPTTEGFRQQHPDAPTHMGCCPGCRGKPGFLGKVE